MPDGEKRGRGRPPKAPEKGKRQNYTFRLHDSTRERLLEAAQAANRSLSEEIEYRVERSFDQEEQIDALLQLNEQNERSNELAEQIIKDTMEYIRDLHREQTTLLEQRIGAKVAGLLGQFAEPGPASSKDTKE